MQKNSNSNSIVTFDGVSKSFGTEVAVNNLSFHVNEGEFFAMVGPSGCGKSTVLKIIAGLEAPDQGQATKPASVSMVFQAGALLPWLNVFDNAAFGLRARHVPEQLVISTTNKLLNMTGLKGLEQKYPRDLSGGQRQRVGIARALAVGPKLLLLDEPFSALDIVTTEELHKDLLQIWKQTGITIIMVSHLVEEAVALADRIMLMKAGKEIQTFPVDLARPRREQGEAFMRHTEAIRHSFFA